MPTKFACVSLCHHCRRRYAAAFALIANRRRRQLWIRSYGLSRESRRTKRLLLLGGRQTQNTCWATQRITTCWVKVGWQEQRTATHCTQRSPSRCRPHSFTSAQSTSIREFRQPFVCCMQTHKRLSHIRQHTLSPRDMTEICRTVYRTLACVTTSRAKEIERERVTERYTIWEEAATWEVVGWHPRAREWIGAKSTPQCFWGCFCQWRLWVRVCVFSGAPG